MQIQNESIYDASSHSGSFINKTRERRMAPGMESIDADENFHDREKTLLFERVSNVDAALYKIIIFATEAAQTSTTIRCGLVDAGALSLVIVAFVNAQFLPSNLLDMGSTKGKKADHLHIPIPSDVIRTEAVTLSALMHDSKFRKSWREKQFNIRRRLCSSLVDALLGDFGQRDDRSAWTRSLFRKILA